MVGREILVVEDEVKIVEILRDYLENPGFESAAWIVETPSCAMSGRTRPA